LLWNIAQISFEWAQTVIDRIGNFEGSEQQKR
jgi:hypothetical protein